MPGYSIYSARHVTLNLFVTLSHVTLSFVTLICHTKLLLFVTLTKRINMKVKCSFCSKEYEAERKSSKYCSGACRKAANRDDIKPTIAKQEPEAVTHPSDKVSVCKHGVKSDRVYKTSYHKSGTDFNAGDPNPCWLCEHPEIK